MVERALRALRRRLQLMIGRAVVRAAAADGGRVLVTLDMLDGETSGAVEWAEPWGLTSVPLPGSEALTLAVTGERGNKVALPLGDRRHRPKDAVPGETVIFDDQDQRISVKRSEIHVTTPKRLVIEAPVIQIIAASATINGEAIATVTHEVYVGSGSSQGRWPIVTGVGDDG